MIHTVNLDTHGVLEASAGTGKTYSIVELVWRALKKLESLPNPLSQIVVLTFTNKAILELKSRLKRKLRDNFEVCQDPLLKERYFSWLVNFSDLQIETIDAFFSRSLLFLDTKCQYSYQEAHITNETYAYAQYLKTCFWNLMRGITQEPWEGMTQQQIDFLVELSDPKKKKWDKIFVKGYDNRFGFSLKEEKSFLYKAISVYEKVYTQKADVVVDAPFSVPLFTPQELTQALKDIQNIWNHSPKIQSVKISTPSAEFKVYQSICERYAQNSSPEELVRELRNNGLTSKSLEAFKIPKYQKISDVREFFAGIAEILSLVGILSLQVELYLLKCQLHDMLEENPLRYGYKGRKLLCNQLAAKNFGALPHREYLFVDEFQDTSILEWETLKMMFGAPHSKTKIFIVGDPKQAIYRFKGGDFFSYQQARQDILSWGGGCHALTVNYRSSPLLVQRLNSTFSQFLPHYHAVETATSLENSEGIENPLIVLSTDYLIRQDTVEPTMQKLISSIQEDRHTFDSIAILAETNDFLHICRSVLEEHKIPYIYYNQTGLFQSPQAQQLKLLFHVLIHVDEESGTQTSLRGPFFTSYRTSISLDSPSIVENRSILMEYRTFVEKKRWGALRVVLLQQSALQHNVTAQEYEIYEQLINYCILYLQSRKDVKQLLDHMDELSTWEKLTHEENKYISIHPIHKGVVQLLTIHGSKGLEFDVTYLFLKSPGKDRSRWSPYLAKHFEQESYKMKLILAEDPFYDQQMKQEAQQEKDHLYYVALTRAKKKIVVPIPSLTLQENQKDLLDQYSLFRALGNHMAQDLDHYQVGSSQKNILPDIQIEQADWNMSFYAHRSLRMVSYSSLSHQSSINPVYFIEHFDPKEDQEWEYPLLPGGKETGILLHALLENLKQLWVRYKGNIDFYVQDMMRQFLFGDISSLDLIAFLNGALGAVRLKQLFSFPLIRRFLLHIPETSINIERIPDTPAIFHYEFVRIIEVLLQLKLPHQSTILQEIIFHRSVQEITAKFSPYLRSFRTYMESTLDMVFIGQDQKLYFLDWKMDNLSSYHSTMLEEHVRTHYQLQWKIYLMAMVGFLETFLKDFSYERHIGGFYYIFVRGLETSTKGILYHKAPMAEEFQYIAHELQELIRNSL